MPKYTVELGPKGKLIAKAMLSTPGNWDDLEQWEKAAWNRATAAIGQLMDLYEADAIADERGVS